MKVWESPRSWETRVEGHSFLLGFRERVKATVRKPGDHADTPCGSRWNDTMACILSSSCLASTVLPGCAREVGSNLHPPGTVGSIVQWWTTWFQKTWVSCWEFSSSIYQLTSSTLLNSLYPNFFICKMGMSVPTSQNALRIKWVHLCKALYLNGIIDWAVKVGCWTDFLCLFNKLPQTWWLNTTEIYFLTVIRPEV